MTETAFLQDAAPTPQPTPTVKRSATPRPKKGSTNTTTNAVTIDPASTGYDVVTSNLAVNGVPGQTPAPANSTVRGKVFYTDTGRAVKRAPIMLMGDRGMSGGPSTTPSALTDNDGNFQIKNVQAGVYYAMVNAPGVISPMAFLDFSRIRGGGSEREEFEKAAEGFEKIIVDGVTDLDVQIPARRGGAIGGRVMYDNGDPAIGVKVEILRKVNGRFLPVVPNFGAIFAMLTGSGVYQTDDRGVYRFAGLPAGEYIVKVSESVSHSEPGESRRGYGEFESMFGGGGNSLLNIFYQNAVDSKSANVINVELGQEIIEINLTIPTRSLYKIEGKIVSRKDKSPVKARVSIKREGEQDVHSIFSELGGRRELSAVTDANGNWKFKELPKGNYKLLIEPAQSENEYREFQGDYSHYGNTNPANTNVRNNLPPPPKFAKKVQEITLEDRDLSEMVIELGYGATIAGTVTVENNEKMPRRVVISTSSAENELTSSDSVSNYDAGGDVTTMHGVGNSNVLRSSANVMRPSSAGVTDGDFELENVSEGKTDIFIFAEDENYYVKSAKADGVDLLSGKFEIKDGDNIRNVRIILSKEVGTLKGKVVNENGEAIKNTTFSLVPTDAARRGSSTFFRVVKTDAAGEFETKLAPMEYAVVFVDQEIIPRKADELDEWYNKAVKDAQKVAVEAGRTENLTVRKIKK